MAIKTIKKFEMLNIICNNCNLTAKEILVAHYFVYRSNQEGVCYPAVNTIARHCGVSERTIQRATKKLQERGYISISKRDINGKQTSNSYRLILGEDNKEATYTSEAGIVAAGDNFVTDNVAVEGQMNVISLEELLMTNDNEKQANEHLIMDSFMPSGEAAIAADNTNTEELPAEQIEELQRETISEDSNTYDDVIASGGRYTATGRHRKIHNDITIQIATMIWINDRILFIYKIIDIIINPGCFMLRINIEYTLVLHRYILQSRRFFMPGLGVPP